MPGTFELKKSSDNQFYFHLKAENGEKILASETYKAKAGAENGIQSVKTNAPLDARYEKKVSSDNKHYFVLLAANKEVIGKSETYSSKEAMEAGIASVKRDAPTATTKDLAT